MPELGLELVWVAPGNLPAPPYPEAPTRMLRGCWAGKYEVTQAEYEAIMGKNPSSFVGARNPVETVSWLYAVGFCTKLTERERAAGRLPEGYEYRLPTVAEWEYAGCGGVRSKCYRYAGSNSPDEVGWHRGNSGNTTHPVGQKKPNELGLHDMSGNVAEWSADVAVELRRQMTKARAARGGGYLNGSYAFPYQGMAIGSRGGHSAGTTHKDTGFRAYLAPVAAPPSGQDSKAGPQSGGTQEAAQPTAAAPSTVEGRAWTVPEQGMEFVWVAPGSFQMGSNDGNIDEKPVHAVTLSKGFWLGKHEVTQAEYETLMGTNPSRPFKGARNPVGYVSWYDATAFCTKLTERERAAGRLPAGYEYRLPTEAEWEYAARGGAQSHEFAYSGSNDPGEVAWYRDNAGDTTHPVGQKKANELGLYDMSGNVAEWCLDWYDRGYYGRSPNTDPVDTQADTEGDAPPVSRGGSWHDVVRDVRSAGRHGASTASDLGFRACLAPWPAGR